MVGKIVTVLVDSSCYGARGGFCMRGVVKRNLEWNLVRLADNLKRI